MKEQWVLPPEHNADFVCAMEDVLEVYQRPYDPRRPQVCFDESSKQLIGEVTPGTLPQPGHPAREDYAYVRNGTANLFMFSEPLQGKRETLVTEQRTKVDFAHAIRNLIEVQYPSAEKIVLVLDNLNTHKPASLYEAFPPEEALHLIDKLEIHYTPKHGSWLNMAEIELGILNRRIADSSTLKCEVAAWTTQRNTTHRKIEWRFTTKDARIKLKRLYPVSNERG